MDPRHVCYLLLACSIAHVVATGGESGPCATSEICKVDDVLVPETYDFDDEESGRLKVFLMQHSIRQQRVEVISSFANVDSDEKQHLTSTPALALAWTSPALTLSILAFACFVVGSLFLFSGRSSHIADNQKRIQCVSCDRASFASFLTYSWVNPLVEAGVKRQVDLQDTPPLAPAENTLDNVKLLLRLIDDDELSRRDDPLIRATLRGFWPQLLAMQILNVASYILRLVSPFLLQKVLVFQEAQEKGMLLSRESASRGIMAACALVALGLASLFFDSQISMYKARLTLRMGSALKGAVAVRGLEGKMQTAADETGERKSCRESGVYNVLSFDVDASVDIIWVLLEVWLFPFQLVAALSALFSEVAWAFVPGLAVIIFTKGTIFVMFYWDGVYRARLFSAKDERLGRCREGFFNIRTLQMLGWTLQHESIIQEARTEELRVQLVRLWMQKMPVALDKCLPELAAFATFGYIVTSHNQLKASSALPVIVLIKQLIGPIGQIPVWVNQYKVWRSAYDRTSRLMAFGKKACSYNQQAQESPHNVVAADPDLVALEACNFAWESGFRLRSISLQVMAGEHAIVVGREGQGKSSLLLALLGEMPLESGTFSSTLLRTDRKNAADSPCSTSAPTKNFAKADSSFVSQALITAAVAFQKPWFFAGTLRANVTFGSPFYEELYESVLEACSLKSDLKRMPAEDLTELTVGGPTLSGGQRARVALARAVYHALVGLHECPNQPSLLLLDEPFCALDREVTAEICTALFSLESGCLKHCAVVIASSDPWWHCFLQVPAFWVLRNGQIVARGKLEELCNKGFHEMQEISRFVPVSTDAVMIVPQPKQERRDMGGDDSMRSKELAAAASQMTPTPSSKNHLENSFVTVEEGREHGSVMLSTYDAYLQACGYLFFLILVVALAGAIFSQNLCSFCIVYWTTENKSQTHFYAWVRYLGFIPPTRNGQLLTLYASFVFAFQASSVAAHAMEILGGIQAARRLFSEALTGTLNKPFLWWDANPAGRVLNRFSGDVEVMDVAVTRTGGVIVAAVLYFFGHSLFLTLSNPVALVILPLVILLIEYFARYYRSTIREIQRLILVSSSLVYQEMSEAISGATTVRAFNMQAEVLNRCLRSINHMQQASFAKSVLLEWVAIRMGLVGLILSTFIQFYPVLQYFGFFATANTALIGFAMTYSQDLVSTIQQFVMGWSNLEMEMISIERLCEYADSTYGPSAASSQSRGMSAAPPASQKDRSTKNSIAGNVVLELENVEVTYRKGLPPALQSVTLFVAAKETLAVVGRTGAGKSSLMLAILQLVPYTGFIKVDGYRFTAGTLQARIATRQLIAVVPQQPVIFSGSLRRNLDPERQFRDEDLWEAMESVGLQQACAVKLGLEMQINGSPEDARSMTDVISLSMGQQQLLCAARAMLRQPRVALLDEVTAMMHSEAARSTVSTLFKGFRACDAATLLITHQEDLISCCTRVVRMCEGQIISDSTV